MHGERYPDAPTAGAIVQQMGERIRQLEAEVARLSASHLAAENTMLRETLRLTVEDRGNWEREAKARGAVEWNAHD